MAGCGAVGTTGTVQYSIYIIAVLCYFGDAFCGYFWVCFVLSLRINLTADREFSCQKLVTDLSPLPICRTRGIKTHSVNISNKHKYWSETAKSLSRSSATKAFLFVIRRCSNVQLTKIGQSRPSGKKFLPNLCLLTLVLKAEGMNKKAFNLISLLDRTNICRCCCYYKWKQMFVSWNLSGIIQY